MEKIQPFLKEAQEITRHINENDVPFIALVLALSNAGIWANDKHLLNTVRFPVLMDTTEPSEGGSGAPLGVKKGVLPPRF